MVRDRARRHPQVRLISEGRQGLVFARNAGLDAATGEAIAHLHYLERRGRAERHTDAEGVDWWTLTTKEAVA